MKRHVFFCSISLDKMAGGLERIFIGIADYLNKEGFKISLITFDWETAKPFFRLDRNIVWHRVATSEPHSPISFKMRFLMLLKIRKIVKAENHPVIVCFHHGIVLRLLFATAGLKKNIIVSERNSLSLYRHIRAKKWNMNFLSLAFVDRIVVQFDNYVKDYPVWLRKKIRVVPNSIYVTDTVRNQTGVVSEANKNIICVGRLGAQKRMDELIIAFSRLSPRYPGWKLKIIGEGENRLAIERQVKNLGIESHVLLIKPTNEIGAIYRDADIFCTTSKWEGFPNAVAEAMAHALPVVGYSDCSGVNELVKHNSTGFLVKRDPDNYELGFHLDLLMGNSGLREKMGKKAEVSVKKYRAKNIHPKWKDILNL